MANCAGSAAGVSTSARSASSVWSRSRHSSCSAAMCSVRHPRCSGTQPACCACRPPVAATRSIHERVTRARKTVQEVEPMTDAETSKMTGAKAGKSKAISHKHERAAAMQMETAETSKPRIDIEQIGHVGTSVKDGIVSSLKGINEIEAEIVSLVRNIVSNTLRASGEGAIEGIAIR